MSRRVCRHLRLVSAHLHTAPPPRALLAGVVEVQHAITALANLRPIKISEQRGDTVRNRPKQVFGFAWIIVRVGPEALFCDNQPGPHGVAGHELVDFLNGRTLNIPTGLIFDDLLPEFLPQLM